MWPTPTPMPVQTPQFVPDIDGGQLGQTIAGGMIQGWNYLNSQPFFDLVFVIVLVLAIIVIAISIRAHLEDI